MIIHIGTHKKGTRINAARNETKRHYTNDEMSEAVSFNKQGHERSVTVRGIGCEVNN